MTSDDTEELRMRLVPYGLEIEIIIQIASPFKVEYFEGMCKCSTLNGTIGAYRITFEEAVTVLCLEILRSENPLTKWNRH